MQPLPVPAEAPQPSSPSGPPGPNPGESRERYDLTAIPFALFHVAAVVGIALVGWSWQGAAICLGLYFLRMFGITAGYHRYFSHRAYKTGRAFQFLLALTGTLAMQKGVLWWASHHRDHHRHSDTEKDIHSPIRRGFFWSHMGWFLNRRFDQTKLDRIRDFAKYPELMWLDRNSHLVPILSGLLLWAVFGTEVFVWGALVSTVLLWHGTFTINSLTHLFGRKRYETGDHSRNSFLLAVITMGEGWHNNHHYYQSTANQGFFWWELDLSYYALKTLSWLGIVWDLRTPPAHVLEGKLRPRSAPASQPDRALEELPSWQATEEPATALPV